MTEETPEPQDDGKVVVFMRDHLRGHSAGQRRYVTQAEAEWLVANKHADWPKSKQ